jgi:hypothetical protein
MTCACGCGQETRLAPCSNASRGHVKGKPFRYIHGHNSFKQHYVEADRGFGTPCWAWQLTKSKDGHGRLDTGDRLRMAHIVYYERAHGSLAPGLHLHHRCEQPDCVNPDHLEPLTPAAHRHRHSKKLSWPIVRQIRARYAAGGTTYQRLGDEFGLSLGYVHDLIHQKSWRET